MFICVKVLLSVSKKGIGITGHFEGPQEKQISDSLDSVKEDNLFFWIMLEIQGEQEVCCRERQ